LSSMITLLFSFLPWPARGRAPWCEGSMTSLPQPPGTLPNFNILLYSCQLFMICTVNCSLIFSVWEKRIYTHLFIRGVSKPLFVHTRLYLYAKLNSACLRSLPLETLSWIPLDIRSRINWNNIFKTTYIKNIFQFYSIQYNTLRHLIHVSSLYSCAVCRIIVFLPFTKWLHSSKTLSTMRLLKKVLKTYKKYEFQSCSIHYLLLNMNMNKGQ
jgi:hypothetical protein